MEIKYCANCGAEVSGKFCSQCGAKFARKDVTMKSLIAVIFETVTNWEQKMLRTLEVLIRDPGRVVKAFIQGDRRKYFHPVRFILFWGGLNLLVSNYWRVGLGDIDPNMEVHQKTVMTWLANYGTFFYISAIPILSLSPFLFFRKLDPVFVHHTVILCYITGMNLLISIPSIALEGVWKEFGPIRDAIGAILPFIYIIWFYHSYFKQTIWKSISAGLITMVFLFIAITLIIGGLVFVLNVISF